MSKIAYIIGSLLIFSSFNTKSADNSLDNNDGFYSNRRPDRQGTIKVGSHKIDIYDGQFYLNNLFISELRVEAFSDELSSRIGFGEYKEIDHENNIIRSYKADGSICIAYYTDEWRLRYTMTIPAPKK